MTENNENINSSEDKLIKKHWYKKSSNIIILSIIILLLIFNYNFTFVIVNGESMEPNYTDGNFLLAERQYKYLSRFDVVVVNSKAANKVLIKRIIGLPGDEIEYKDNQLFVNGEYVSDAYGSGYTNNFKVTVEEGTYFCLGDNRENSYDSRKYGVFSEKEIIAKIKGRRHLDIKNSQYN